MAIQENSASASNLDDIEQSDVKAREIPLVVFSEPHQQDAPTEKIDNDCDEDCESFYPADLMSFAWQIARGMVSYLFHDCR